MKEEVHLAVLHHHCLVAKNRMDQDREKLSWSNIRIETIKDVSYIVRKMDFVYNKLVTTNMFYF